MKNTKLLITKTVLAVLIIVIVLLFIFLLSGCTMNISEDDDIVITEDKISTSDYTLGVDAVLSTYDMTENITYTYLRDKITNVMYLLVEEDHNPGGFDGTSGITVMMNPETGGPLVYEDFIKYVKNTENIS